MWDLRNVEDPDDPILGPCVRLISAYYQEILGPTQRPYPEEELAWRLRPVAGRRWHRLVVALDRELVVGVALQTVPWDAGPTSYLRIVMVHPELRRRGIARSLLDRAASAASDEGRVRLGWQLPYGGPGTTAFAAAQGAELLGVFEQNRVATSALDRSTLETWVESARDAARNYELIGWDGPCPDEHLEAFASMQALMEDAPGNRPEDAVARTIDRLRQREAFDLGRGPNWRVCVRHIGSGTLVGYTELQPLVTRPWLANQGDTVVAPIHRGNGLGRWMKARNALRILDEQPEVDVIETANDETNGPMLEINRAMGFVPVCRWVQWSRAL